MNICIQYFSTSLGELILGSFNEQLCLCDWRYRHKRNEIDKRIQQTLSAAYQEKPSATIETTQCQLKEYFSGERATFELPLLLAGTQFQQQVWNALCNIPYGATATYMSLSEKLGNTKAIRAVAAANGANAISIIIPCHRIIGSNGALIGYAGGLKTKQALLELEQGNIGQMKLF